MPSIEPFRKIPIDSTELVVFIVSHPRRRHLPMLKALTAKPQFQGTPPFYPLGLPGELRNTANFRLDPPHFAVSAALSGEEDFELGGEFLDVFVRAGERVAGFFVGCMLIAGVWLLCVTL
jgi:hypothetical protein